MILSPRNALLLGNRKRLDTKTQEEHVEKVVTLFLKTIER